MQFYVVYIREAHAIDSAAPMGGGAAPIVEDPLHLAERKEVARTCMRAVELEELDIFRIIGLPVPEGPPLVHFARELRVRAFPPRRVGR